MNIPDRRIEETVRFLDLVFDRTNVLPVVAGGFVRDALIGGPARDIDMYVDASDYSEVLEFLKKPIPMEAGENLIDFLDRQGAGVEQFSKGHDAYDHQYIQMHEEFEVTDELKTEFPLLFTDRKIDLIALREPQTGDQIISKFNIGISQCYILMDGQGYVVETTPAFDADRQFQTITVLRDTWGREATAKSVAKIVAKYPHYQAVHRDGSYYDEASFLMEREQEVF